VHFYRFSISWLSLVVPLFLLYLVDCLRMGPPMWFYLFVRISHPKGILVFFVCKNAGAPGVLFFFCFLLFLLGFVPLIFFFFFWFYFPSWYSHLSFLSFFHFNRRARFVPSHPLVFLYIPKTLLPVFTPSAPFRFLCSILLSPRALLINVISFFFRWTLPPLHFLVHPFVGDWCPHVPPPNLNRTVSFCADFFLGLASVAPCPYWVSSPL